MRKQFDIYIPEELTEVFEYRTPYIGDEENTFYVTKYRKNKIKQEPRIVNLK